MKPSAKRSGRKGTPLSDGHGEVLALYYFKGRNAVLGPGIDCNDASCRPDPDFEVLSLGVCRPPFRNGFRTEYEASPARRRSFLFFTRTAGKVEDSRLLLVALLRVESVLPSHAAARRVLSGRPPNLLVPGNACLAGSTINFATGAVARGKVRRKCSCAAYVNRNKTPYLLFAGGRAAVRPTRPVPLSFAALPRLAARWAATEWPNGFDPDTFLKKLQRGPLWVEDPADIRKLKAYFRKRRAAGARPNRCKLLPAHRNHRVERDRGHDVPPP